MRSYAMKAETGLVMRGGETNGVLVGATGSVADFRKGRTMAGSDGFYSLITHL